MPTAAIDDHLPRAATGAGGLSVSGCGNLTAVDRDQQIVLAEDAGRIASTGDAEHDHSGGEGIAAKPIRQGRRELRHHGPLQRPLLDNEALVGISLARQGLHPRRQRLDPPVAQDGHLHLIIGRAGADAVVQPALVVDLLAVDRRDHVALTHPRAGGRAVRIDVGDHQPLRAGKAQAAGDVAGDRIALHPQPGPHHRLGAAQGAVDHPLDHGGRHGEADPGRRARAREDGGVDADQIAVHVHQGPARIAGVDGRIGLDERA